MLITTHFWLSLTSLTVWTETFLKKAYRFEENGEKNVLDIVLV